MQPTRASLRARETRPERETEVMVLLLSTSYRD